MKTKKKLYKETAKVMRVSGVNYENLKLLKEEFAIKHNKSKVTFDAFIAELIEIARMLLDGQEVYATKDRLFTDLAEARGQAIMDAVKLSQIPIMPRVLLLLGEDDGLKK